MPLKFHDPKLVVHWLLGLTVAVPLLVFITWVTAMTGIQKGITPFMIAAQVVTMLAVIGLCIKRAVDCYRIVLSQLGLHELAESSKPEL